MSNSTLDTYLNDDINYSTSSSSILTATLVVIATLLILEQAVYKYKKQHLPVSFCLFKQNFPN